MCILWGRLMQSPRDESIPYRSKWMFMITVIFQIRETSRIVTFCRYGGTALKCIPLCLMLSCIGPRSFSFTVNSPENLAAVLTDFLARPNRSVCHLLHLPCLSSTSHGLIHTGLGFFCSVSFTGGVT